MKNNIKTIFFAQPILHATNQANQTIIKDNIVKMTKVLKDVRIAENSWEVFDRTKLGREHRFTMRTIWSLESFVNAMCKAIY